MVGCGLACLGGGGAGVSGCEFRGRGGGGTVGARIRGLRVSGRRAGGGGPGGPYHMGGGGVATRNTGPYIVYLSLSSPWMRLGRWLYTSSFRAPWDR